MTAHLSPDVQAAAIAALEARKALIGPWIDRADDLGMHKMALKPGLKEPASGSTGWPDLPQPTGDQAEAWMLEGGNLGCNLGRSQMILWDADNEPGAQALLDAGYRPWVIPANAQNPNHSKGRFRGRHFLWRRPEAWNVKDDDLSGGQVRLPNGGTIDVLCGRHYFVLPPSVLCEEGFVATYRDAAAIGWAEEIDELPTWAWPDEFRPADAPEPPAGLEALRGKARRITATEKVERDARSNEISEAVDAISWDEWLAGETRLSDDTSASCGCDRKKWYASSNPGSIALHDCWLGKFARIHSDTMAFELDADQRSMSALSLHALLHRQSVRESARQHSIDMGSEFGFNEALDNTADLFEAHAEDEITATVLQLFPARPRQAVDARGGISFLAGPMTQVHADSDYWAREAAGCRGLARQLRGGTSALPQNGPEVFDAPQVMGAPSQLPTQVPQQAAPPETGPIDVEVVEETPTGSTPNTPVVDDAIDGEFVEDDDEWVIRGADAIKRIRELEEKLKGKRDPHTNLWVGMTPGLGRIASLAESRGVFPSGLTGAIMPRVAARIPANVIIEPEHGVCENKVEGVGFSHSALLIGPSATGKTKTEITAAAAVPMLPGIAEIPSGTAEGIVKEARSWESTGKGRGKVEVHTTSVFVQADEVGTVKAEVQRDASKYASFICSATMGNTIVGQTASDKTRKAAWPPHSTRLAQSIGAQPHKCGFLLDDAGSGAGARFDWVPVGSVDPAERGPLYGTPVPPVLPNGRLPWDPPVGIPFGFRPYSGPDL